MPDKAPTILIVLVETEKLRWFVAGLGLDGLLAPLICSDEDDLGPYRGLDFDGQVTFLRHRFCGVLQRGCNRLWDQQKKACQFLFLFEGLMPAPEAAEPELLTEKIADHMVEWMLNPPVAVLTCVPGAGPEGLERMAGELDHSHEALLRVHFESLRQVRTIPAVWDQVRHKGAWINREG